MEDGGPSVTAQRVAAHRLGFTRVPATYGDPAADVALAVDVAAGREAPANRMHDYLAARTTFFDRTVVAAIGQGIRQVVVGAAGYDGPPADPGSRPYNLLSVSALGATGYVDTYPVRHRHHADASQTGSRDPVLNIRRSSLPFHSLRAPKGVCGAQHPEEKVRSPTPRLPGAGRVRGLAHLVYPAAGRAARRLPSQHTRH